MKHIDFNFLLLLLAVLVGVASLYCYCYYGKIATESYEEMTNRLYESNWYEHSTHLQKYFIVMLGNMQKPLHYHGSGIAVLNLETFTTVKSF